jgi:ribonuclease HI
MFTTKCLFDFICSCLIPGVRLLELRTDSQFMMDCMTNWIHRWKDNGWKTSRGTEVANRAELEELDFMSSDDIYEEMAIRYVSASLLLLMLSDV